MVYVFPEFVTPYVNKRPLWPSKTSFTRGRVVLVKKSDCSVAGGNTWEKVYIEVGLRVDIRERAAFEEEGSVMRIVVSEIGSIYGVLTSSVVSSPM